MGQAIVTVKIMPQTPEVDLSAVKEAALQKIAEFAGEGETKSEEQPVAFGLKALQIIFVMDEDQGSTEPIENSLQEIEGVQSVEITDVRRALG